ncbi:MAG: LamG-like jellyroll fold domain-containing protein, partial [Lachnospiraceae bacterium]
MQRKKTFHRFRKRIIAGLCSVCLAATGIPTLLPQTSYAAETTDTTDANGLPVLGLSANLFCLSDTADATNANLQWGDSFDKSTLDHYEVQRSTDGNYHTIYQTTGCLFQDYDLTLNQMYQYQVLAIGSNGAVLATSNVVALTPCSVSSDLDTHSNLTGGELNYATSGTKVGDTYYSYSMKSENNVSWLVESTSTDGKTFGNERTVADQSQNADLGSCKLESVQMKYIEKANKMIIWAHWEKPDGYADGKALVITGTPGGEFTVHHIYNPLDIQVRDMSIFVDDDGTGYLIAATSKGSEGANHTMRIFKMNSEYNDVTEVTKELFIGQYREFPNMTKRDGYYYLFTSQAAGWYPSQGAYAVTKQISGDWSALRNIGNTSTFSCQSGWIQSVGDKGNCVMHAYRWLRSGDTPGTHLCPMYFANGYAFYDYCTSFRYSTATGELYPVQQGRLLSLNKPALATISAKGADNGTTFYVSNAFDGDYQSCFSSNDKTWPFALQVDLEHVCDLSNVQISWYMCKGSEAYYTYYIEGSNDGQNWTKLLDRTDTSSERVSKTYGFTSDALSGTARYVRLTVTNARPQNNPNNNWYSPTVYEVKVFGTPSSDTADTEQISRDPLAYYPLHGAQNGAVEDVMGNKGALQVHGNYRFIKDADNPMLYLDGSDGTYASLPEGLLDGIDDFSISFRAKPEQADKENFFTLALGIDSSKYFLVKTATDASRFAITKTEEQNNGWKGESGGKSTASAADWSRYTVVVHGKTGYLYRNNTLIASAALNQRLSELGEHLTGYIGKSFYGDDSYFKGSISEIAFYDYALSSEQIQNMVGVVYEKEHHCEDEWITDSTTHKRKCKICGSYVDEAAHTFPKEYEVVKEPTCTESGYGVYYCEVCHYQSEEKVVIPAKGHTFGEWEVVTPATTKEEGEERRICSDCGYEETRSIDKISEPSSSQPSEDTSSSKPS